MTVRTSSASSAWDSTVKSTRSENKTVTSLRCSAAARSTSPSRCSSSGCDGRVDDRVAEHRRAAPRAPRWHRRSPPACPPSSTLTKRGRRLRWRASRAEREHPSGKPRERIVARCSVTGRFDAHRQRLEGGRRGRPTAARVRDRRATSRQPPRRLTTAVELGRPCSASASASAQDDRTVSSHSSSRRDRVGVGGGGRRSPSAAAPAARTWWTPTSRRWVGVVRRPPSVGAVAGSPVDRRRTEHPLRPGLEGDLPDAAWPGPSTARPPATAPCPPGRDRSTIPNEVSVSTAEPGVVGEHAGVAGRPRATRAAGPSSSTVSTSVGPTVRSRSATASSRARSSQTTATSVIPPPSSRNWIDRRGTSIASHQRKRGMQGAAEVVLQHLTFVERPAMVLVLAVVPPPAAEEDADVHPVARQAVRRRGSTLADPGHQHARPRGGPAPPRASSISSSGTALSGSDHHVDDVDLVERRGEQSIDEIEIDRFGRDELEEPERLPIGALHRLLPRAEVAVPDPQRPRQQQDVGAAGGAGRLPDAAPAPCATPRRRRDRARRRSERATAARCRRPGCAPWAAPACAGRPDPCQ